MNGASADPWANTSRAPTAAMTRMMGRSHHFLRARMKAQNSSTRLVRLIALSFFLISLELPLHVTPTARADRSRHPAARPAPVASQRVSAEGPEQQADRGDRGVVHDPKKDRGRDLGNGSSEARPGSGNRSETRGNDHAGGEQQGAERERHRGGGATAPCQRAPQHEERRADGQPEAASLGGAQSSWNSRLQSPLSCHSGWLALSSRNGPSTR